jgi:alkenylglycerophosphocholine hydrolase
MIDVWLVLALACMAADWAALWFARPRINYVTKPLTLVLLMVWFWSAAQPGWVTFCFVLGLFFSLAGDAFLLLPSGYFMHGLIAFLCAHLCYLAGFVIGVESLPLLFWALAGLIGVWAGVVIWRLAGAARRNSRHRKMATPIALYASAISLMFLFAIWTNFRPEWRGDAAILAACGALLFYFSDLWLAYDRFVMPVRHARLMVRVTYHLGQLALAAGAILYSHLN